MASGRGAGEEQVVRLTFVVRITRAAPELSGVVERLKTGEREPFHTVDAIGQIIARMLHAEGA
jgi:hypothetical protein